MKVFKMKCGDGLEIDSARVVFRHFAEVVIHSPDSVKVKRIPAEKEAKLQQTQAKMRENFT